MAAPDYTAGRQQNGRMLAHTMVAILALAGCTLKGGSPQLPGQAEIHDGDHDGYFLADDCNDEDDAVHPGAIEHCDGIDNDCDNWVDGPESVDAVEYWADTDTDGFGGTPIVSCTQPIDTVVNDLDCDDSRWDVNPDVTEYCGDSIDNDCDAGTTCTWVGEAATSMADATIVGDSPQIGVGIDVAGAGDIDGDGVGDLIVGSASEAAFLFLGPVTSTSTNHADATLMGVTGDEKHGMVVLGIEDQAADGYADIAVSALYWSDRTGRVYIVSGPISGTMTSDTLASTTISGVEAGGYFGWALGGGDVDGDDVADFVVSAPGARDGEGDVYVFRGPVTAGDLSSADAAATISAPTADDFTGGSISCAGDLDGDGIDDLAMTVGDDAWLLLGPVTVDRTATRGSDGQINTPTSEYRVWITAISTGDLDADGIDDLAIAAGGNAQPDEAWLVSGPIAAVPADVDVASAAMATIGGDAGDNFGTWLDASSDFDGDGARDVVVTALDYHNSAGAAFVFYGPLSGTLTTDDAGFRIWGDTYEYAGALARYTGDLDGDGITELALSSRPWGSDWQVTLWFGGGH